jgi:hypothetical protein
VIALTGCGVEVMWEWWSTRWYAPLLAMGALLAALLVAAVAVIGLVAAKDSSAVAPSPWTAPLDRAAAFRELGDRDVLAKALRVAEQQAGRDPVERARERSAVDRWATTPPALALRDPTLTGGSHDR